MNWNSPAIRALVHTGLTEDAARHDITTQSLIPFTLKIRAEIRAHQVGVICGLPLAKAFFQTFDPQLTFRAVARDGQRVRPGTLLAVIQGRARSILSAERPALNALQHLSGISTYTHLQVQRLGPGHTKLYDTRKTLPGWRALQKYAVKCGGATNHRSTLDQAIMIKDNHLKVLRLAGIDWLKAARRLRRHVRLPFEMEIQGERDVREALRLKPPIVLLDNIRPSRRAAIIREFRRGIPGVEIEISGRVRPEQLKRLGRLGAERISMGRLTHSTSTFDCSLSIVSLQR